MKDVIFIWTAEGGGSNVAAKCYISSRGKILILGNVIQSVFLLFNHVEGIWCGPRLFISRNVNESERGGEKERERLCAWMEKKNKIVGAFGSYQLVLHANIFILCNTLKPRTTSYQLFTLAAKIWSRPLSPLTTLPNEMLWGWNSVKRFVLASVPSVDPMWWQKAKHGVCF